MLPSLFISYCRRETAFVNSLEERLTHSSCTAWLDYRNLVPGTRWEDQITVAIAEAEVFLLVVSKEAIASENVRLEWQEAQRLKKRIVLVIFEAVKLPDALKHCEWIDFRKNSFKRSVCQLINQLAQPQLPSTPPPEAGFKAPVIVWGAFWVSILVSICSILTFWTVYLPYHLVPLPYRILNRNFHLSHVQASALMLPFALFWTFAIFLVHEETSEGVATFAFATFLICIIPAFILLILLRLPGIQRWGKPMATSPKFFNRYNPEDVAPELVTFAIDAAPEDAGYARSLVQKLEKFGHTYTTNTEAAQVIIVLLSAFKKSSIFDPQTRAVYPVIIQDVDDLDPVLGSIQWIDFRRGIRHFDLKCFSLLMSQPNKILKALGIIPSSQQTVFPLAIQVIVYGLTLQSFFLLGSILITLFVRFFYPQDLHPLGGLSLMISSGIGLIISWHTRNSVITRRGVFASRSRLTAAIAFLGLVITTQTLTLIVYASDSMEIDNSIDMLAVAFVAIFLVYIMKLITVTGLMVVFRGSLKRWLGTTAKTSKRRVAMAASK